MRWMLYIAMTAVVTALSCVPAPIRPEERPFLYRSISFDIAFVGTSSRPRQGALDHFRRSLAEMRLCASDNVHFNVRRVFEMEQQAVWNTHTLTALELVSRGVRSWRTSTPRLSVFVAYVPGVYFPPPEPDMVVCGFCYGTASFAVLTDEFERPTEEAALLLHEFGHVMNLPGTDHCENNTCVLYEYVRLDGARFCAHCLDRIDTLRYR